MIDFSVLDFMNVSLEQKQNVWASYDFSKYELAEHTKDLTNLLNNIFDSLNLNSINTYIMFKHYKDKDYDSYQIYLRNEKHVTIYRIIKIIYDSGLFIYELRNRNDEEIIEVNTDEQTFIDMVKTELKSI